MAHLIAKLAQRPRKAYIYPSNEHEAHYILEIEVVDLLETENLGTQEEIR